MSELPLTPKFPSVVAGVYFLPTKPPPSFPNGSLLYLKKFVKVFQPLAEKTPQGNKLRKEQFRSCDGNGTGYCSLSDVESYVLTRLTTDYGENKGLQIFKMYRPSYIRAFFAAKVVAKGSIASKSTNVVSGDDYVTINEFRVLNAYLCIHASMLDAFSRVDGGGKGHIDIEDDRRIDKQEWIASYKDLEGYGFVGLSQIQTASLAIIAFDTMDSDNKGMVLFEEFCTYIKEKEVESKTDLGKLLSGNMSPIVPKASPNKVNTRRSADPDGSKNAAKPMIICGAYQVGHSASQELMDFVRVFQPLAEKSLVGKKDRFKHFAYADQNHNGYASLAEIEVYIKHALTSAFPKIKAKDLFLRFRKCYIKAFQRAKSLHDAEGDGQLNGTTCEDYVTFSEFRLFNAYLCIYAAMLDSFIRMNATSDRIDFPEFMASYNHVRDYGFVAFSAMDHVKEATEIYGELDVDSSGEISYSEWCNYIIASEMKAGTKLGKLMDKQRAIHTEEKSTSTQTYVKSVRKGIPKKIVKTFKPITVCGAYSTGNSVSQELMDFLRVFQPLAEKSLVGKKDRQRKFAYADQNHNGYASLAEIEVYIKYSLTSAFPKIKAKDLFLRFRKCYIKAFQRAKSLHDAEGDGQLNGTTCEEYVTFSEFRLFNAYLCIYAAMLDAFSQINATSDRIDFGEFKSSYSYVQNYGFVALSSITNDNQAIDCFNELDIDGSSQISYNEWCNYIIEAEVKAGTELGKLM